MARRELSTREVVEELEQLGATDITTTPTRKGGFKICFGVDGTSQRMFVSKTSSDSRAQQNNLSLARRIVREARG